MSSGFYLKERFYVVTVQVGLYLARKMKANLVNPRNNHNYTPPPKNHAVMQMEKLCSETKIWVFSPSFLQALYITDMPTTAAWIDHAFGYYQEVFAAC